MLRVGTILNGRYEIISAIGSGGMSNVYKAKDMTLKRLVAVKVLKDEYSRDAGVVAKFAREAEAAGGLSHPNVVSVYDVGQQYGIYYIIMELVEGFTLKKYIEKKGKMSQRDAVQVTMQVARGLGAAHDQGIIHRDVKPQNIMVSRDGKIKVTDFGIARINDSQASGANTMGSVHYISPEQARGGVCDERSDIYSLGISLYEMVTGRVPFEGESTVEVALKHIKEPITPPSTYEPDINPNLEKIILKCTQKKADYRYRSMNALLDDLKRLLATPYEDFVIMPAVSEIGATKIMNREEAEEIRLAVADRKDHTDAKAAAAMIAAEQPEKKAKPAPKKQPAVSPEREIEELLSQEDLEAEARAKKVEKTLNYIMIGVAMLILIVMIAIVFRACGMFRPTAPTTKPAVSTSSVRPLPSQSSASQTEAVTTQESTTSAEVIVPNVVGYQYETAQNLLTGLGLTVKFEVQNTSEYPESTVFRQSYSEGTVLRRGDEITIWVAIPSDTAVVVPTSISGKTIAEATMILTQAELVVADTYSYAYSSVEKGMVCEASPSMGKVIDKGTMVKLVISLGPEKGQIPAVLGKTEEEARAALKEAGFSEDHIITDSVTAYSEEYAAGTIAKIYTMTEGDLAAGSSLNFSTDIYLTLSRGATFTIDPEPFLGRKDIDGAVNDLMSVGLRVITIPEPESTYPDGAICWLTLTESGGDVTAEHVFIKGDIIYLHYSTREETTQPVPTQETEPVETPEENTQPESSETDEPEQTVRISIVDKFYDPATTLESVRDYLESLGLVVQVREEPTSAMEYGRICWLTTEETSGTITSETDIPVGSTVWVHISTNPGTTEAEETEQSEP